VADMVWGLVPRWSKEPATPYTTVTARLERAPRSRIYAQAWAQRPCVLPMTGYYKWDRARRPPWPLFVQRKDGRVLLAAGLWEHWESEDGQQLDSFTVLTGPNHAIPAPLTPDGPIFIAPATALDWLSGAFKTPAPLRPHWRPIRSAARFVIPRATITRCWNLSIRMPPQPPPNHRNGMAMRGMSAMRMNDVQRA